MTMRNNISSLVTLAHGWDKMWIGTLVYINEGGGTPRFLLSAESI